MISHRIKGVDLIETLGRQARMAGYTSEGSEAIQRIDTFTNAAMPAGATVTHKWDKG